MESLAQFIQKKREKAGLSVQGLAKKTSIKLDFLEDLEAGKELFLSVTQRQQLARVLKVPPKEIKEYERSFEFQEISDEITDNLKARILNHETGLKCPMCGEPLITRIAEVRDLYDNPVLLPKAHCVKCVFQIKE